ncbi:MAG: hypothetical protein GY705_31460 [Bacteroidetes bacterium]|nr:hypothetical protein [Bacteroidota bacterium]
MKTSYIIIPILLLTLFIQPKMSCALEAKKTHAQIEVEEAVNEIKRMELKEKLPFYIEVYEIIRKQDETDGLFLPLSKDFYTFFQDDIVFSGSYKLENNFIEQSHYKEHPITDTDKIKIKKWIEFCNQHKIYGFDVREKHRTSIYLKPNIYLLFLTDEYDQQYLNKFIAEGKDYRGDVFIRLSENIIVATMRR